MLVVYDKTTGAIDYTVDDWVDPNLVEIDENQEVLVTFVEHKNDAINMRVDLDSDPIRLVERTAVILSTDKKKAKPNEVIHLHVLVNGEKLEDEITLTINGEPAQIPFQEDFYEIDFEVPGDYVIEAPDNRYYGDEVIIKIREDI